MRVGPAARFFLNFVALTAKQEGPRAAARAAIRLVWTEVAKIPQIVRLRTRHVTLGERTSRPGRLEQSNVRELSAAFAQLGFEVVPFSLDRDGFARHTSNYSYPKWYAGGSVASGGAREKKMLEYYGSLQLLDIDAADVVIDIASERSLFPDFVTSQIGASVYRQDLLYAPGVRGDRIGGNAANMPIPAAFADVLTLHNSFEHFEGDADTGFIHEAWRVLRPGGRVCIVPLFLANQYEILTDPLLNVRDIDWDPGALVVEAAGYRNRFGRFYSPAALAERVLHPAQDCGFVVKLYRFENIRAIDPTPSLQFGLVLAKPSSDPLGGR